MHSGHAIRAVRSNNSEVSHSNLARGPFFNQIDAFQATCISRKSDAHLVQKPTIDLVNGLQLPGKKNLKPRDWPFLERFRQKGVVGVGQRFPREIPSLVPSKVSIVQ